MTDEISVFDAITATNLPLFFYVNITGSQFEFYQKVYLYSYTHLTSLLKLLLNCAEEAMAVEGI